MIAFEVVLLICVAVVIVTGLLALAKPMTEAFSERLKFRYRDLGSASEVLLKNQIRVLEEEVVSMKDQLKSLQETVEFLSNKVDAQKEDATITIRERQPKD